MITINCEVKFTAKHISYYFTLVLEGCQITSDTFDRFDGLKIHLVRRTFCFDEL